MWIAKSCRPHNRRLRSRRILLGFGGSRTLADITSTGVPMYLGVLYTYLYSFMEFFFFFFWILRLENISRRLRVPAFPSIIILCFVCRFLAAAGSELLRYVKISLPTRVFSRLRRIKPAWRRRRRRFVIDWSTAPRRRRWENDVFSQDPWYQPATHIIPSTVSTTVRSRSLFVRRGRENNIISSIIFIDSSCFNERALARRIPEPTRFVFFLLLLFSDWRYNIITVYTYTTRLIQLAVYRQR